MNASLSFFASWFAILWSIIFFRYVVLSQLYIWSVPSSRKPGLRQFRSEAKFAVLTSLVFAAVSLLVFVMIISDNSKVYVASGHLNYLNELLAPLAFLAGHEVYYYFLHRWMHRRSIYPLFHFAHHRSRLPSAWTSFSFHPIEAVLQTLYFPLFIWLVPINLYSFLGCLALMSLTATINHGGYEIYPRWFLHRKPFMYIIGSTHHDRHHARLHGNYGLYFTCLDLWFGTELFEKETTNLSRYPNV